MPTDYLVKELFAFMLVEQGFRAGQSLSLLDTDLQQNQDLFLP